MQITFRIEKKLKEEADDLFSDFGLSLNSAFIIFIKQSVREQRIPFEITRNNISLPEEEVLEKLSAKLINENNEAYKELKK